MANEIEKDENIGSDHIDILIKMGTSLLWEGKIIDFIDDPNKL
jgi:hypothetical protein